MPRTLHIIKHGRPHTVPGVPAHEWELAEGALDGLDALAPSLRPTPAPVVSSFEPRAHATAAARLGAANRPMHGLHEQLRYTAPYHSDPTGFEADMRRFFEHRIGSCPVRNPPTTPARASGMP